MGIKIRHGDPGAQISAAAAIGERKKKEAAQRQQEQMDFQVALRQQGLTLELEKQERAQRWQIDKMELASRLDFEREERVRQRKLDEFDNIDKQLDKEVDSGRLSEKEIEAYRLKNNLAREGMNVSLSTLIRQDDKEEQFGIPPYWMKGKDAPEGSPERRLYGAELQRKISGEREGTVPFYLNKKWLRENRDIAEQVLLNQEIFFDTKAELDAFIDSPQEAGGEQTDLKEQLQSEMDKAKELGHRAVAKRLYDEGVRLGFWGE